MNFQTRQVYYYEFYFALWKKLCTQQKLEPSTGEKGIKS
jgi:hypothetical protein